MLFFFFFNDTATTEIYTLSLHDALPICQQPQRAQEVKFFDQIGGDQQLHQALLPLGEAASDSSSMASTRALPANDSHGIENSARMKLISMAAPRGQ